MERDNDIMLAIFRHFLKNPSGFKKEGCGANKIELLCPPHLDRYDQVVQWHLAVFLSEFLLDTELLHAFGNFPLCGTGYLTWSGQQLFEELERIDKEK